MVSITLLADTAFSLATAALYVAVGRTVRHRGVSDRASSRALGLFVLWWYAIAAFSVLGAARTLAAALGYLGLPYHVLLSYLSLLPLVAALWGLVYYLVFVHTGNERWLGPLGMMHAGLFVGFLALSVWLRPVAVEAGEWSVTIGYARTLSGPLVAVLLATLLGPVLLAAVAYATLWFRTKDRAARYRVALVSGSFIVWFGSAALASASALVGSAWWPYASRLVGLAATLTLLAAYRPPAPVRRWLDAPSAAS